MSITLDPRKLDLYHHACKIIEVDGINGYLTCRQKYGPDIANVLLIAFLRRNAGSTENYPPVGGFERVIEEVNNILRENGLDKKIME